MSNIELYVKKAAQYLQKIKNEESPCSGENGFIGNDKDAKSFQIEKFYCVFLNGIA